MAQFSDKALEALTDYVEVQGIQWAKEFIAGRKAWLQSQGIRATGELIKSLESEILDTLEGAAQKRLEIAFNTSGRYVEIPSLKPPRGGTEYIASLEQWIEEKGLREKMTANYLSKRNVRQVPPNILNQLAWSVALSRVERHKRRQWYNKPKSASITELFNRIAANLPELVANEIKAAFSSP